MFEYVVVYCGDAIPEIHKCQNMYGVKDTICDILCEHHADEIFDQYIEYVKDEAGCDWAFVPECVNDWLRNMVKNEDDFTEYDIYWE